MPAGVAGACCILPAPPPEHGAREPALVDTAGGRVGTLVRVQRLLLARSMLHAAAAYCALYAHHAAAVCATYHVPAALHLLQCIWPSHLHPAAPCPPSTSTCLQGQPEEELDIDTDGSFARLLVHGLAEFHGLASRSDASSGQCRPVVVYHRKLRAGQQEQQQVVVAGSGQQVEVTCTDVLLALREIGPAGLDTHSLEQFVRTHVHGHDLMDGEYVLV